MAWDQEGLPARRAPAAFSLSAGLELPVRNSMSKASFVLTGALAMAGWIGVAGTLLVLPVTAEAQQKVSQKVGVPLKDAQTAISKKKWDTALAKIKEADGVPGKTAFDQYKI